MFLIVFGVTAEAISKAVNTSHNYLIIIITIFHFIHKNRRSQNPIFYELFGVDFSTEQVKVGWGCYVIVTLNKGYKCINIKMEKMPSNEPMSKQSQAASSDILQYEDGITFISLSHYEMHKLIHESQHFINKVISLNRQAIKQIDLGAYKEALGLLSEGEKILQYAAGSGKTIERDLIICVLHNMATVYHKLWVIEKCRRYIQGVIFNLENYLHSLQNSVASSNQNQQIQLALQGLQMKNLLSSYCLRFCALNSQQENHKEALNACKKAIGYIRNVITFDEHYTLNIIRRESESNAVAEIKQRLLLEILQYENSLSVKKQKDVLKAAHFSYQIWNKQKEKSHGNYKFLKNYSIGDFMEFKSKEYRLKSEQKDPLEEHIKQFEESFTYKIIMLSISFFSTSTELRLIMSENQYYSQLQRENALQFIQAEIYHLLAIIVVTSFIPCEIVYLKHLLSSYAGYFNSGLVDYKTVETESYEKIIELLSENKFKFPNPGSTQIISSEEMLPDMENNDYRLKDHFMEKIKKTHKNTGRNKKNIDKNQSKKNISKNFSSLESKSIIKQEKRTSRTKNKIDSKLKDKTKSKNKLKSKANEKKSKEKYFFVGKVSTSKSKRKHNDEQLGTISKKVSPKKMKDHPFSKQITGSQIVHKNRKKSLLHHKIGSVKRLIHENKSPKKRTNVYGLHY